MKIISEIVAEGWPVFICDDCLQKIQKEGDYTAKLVKHIKHIVTKNRCAICGAVSYGSRRRIEKYKGWKNYLLTREVSII